MFPPHNYTETSKHAAAMLAARYPQRVQRIVAVVKTCGNYGATRDELERATGILNQALCALLNSAAELDLLIVTNARRLSRHHMPQQVYIHPLFMHPELA